MKFILMTCATLIACLVVGTGSYFGAIRIIAGPSIAPPDEETLAEATELRLFSNELLRLNAELEVSTPVQGISSPHDFVMFHRFLRNTMQPRIRNLNRRMLYSEFSSKAMYELLGAGERSFAAMSKPENNQMRRRASDRLRSACRSAEKRIASLDLQSFVTPPPITP